jgi:nicotinate phosphoribosyltransferase
MIPSRRRIGSWRTRPRLQQYGIRIGAVRLDSGDLIRLSKSVRQILDAGGLSDIDIFASGGLTEDKIQAMTEACASAPPSGWRTLSGTDVEGGNTDLADQVDHRLARQSDTDPLPPE